MIVYEVNIEVGLDMLNEVSAWLPNHLQDVLKVSGFKKATIYRSLDNDKMFCVKYYASSMDDINAYLKFHASRLREETAKRFPNNYKVWRRILEEQKIIELD